MNTKEEFLKLITLECTCELVEKYREELAKSIRRKLRNFSEEDMARIIKERQQCQTEKGTSPIS